MKFLLLLSACLVLVSVAVAGNDMKKIDNDYIDDDEFDEDDVKEKLDTSRRGHSIPTTRLRIEASHTTTSKKQLVAKPRLFMAMPGMDILGAMMHPMLMMLGMASFVSMMPTVVQNVGNMVPNLFPLVGNQPAATAPPPASNGRIKLLARILGWRRWRRSVDSGEDDIGPSVIRLTDNVLDVWERFENAMDKVGKIHTGK